METEALAQLNLFLLVLMRMSGCVLLNPILGRRGIPSSVKSAFTLVLAITVCAAVQNRTPAIGFGSVIEFFVLMIWEFFIGFVLGYVMQVIFLVVTWAGGLIDFLMGISMATVYDPQNGQPIPVNGNMFNIFLSLMFFQADGHVFLLRLILYSYETAPYGALRLNFAVAGAIPALFAESALLAVKFAFPILAAEFIMEITMGILMKVVPQINIFVVNIQVKVLLGFTMLLFLAMPISDGMNSLLDKLYVELPRFLQMI